MYVCNTQTHCMSSRDTQWEWIQVVRCEFVECNRPTRGCWWISKFRNKKDLQCIFLHCENASFGEVEVSHIDGGNRNFIWKIGIHLKTYVIKHKIPLCPKYKRRLFIVKNAWCHNSHGVSVWVSSTQAPANCIGNEHCGRWIIDPPFENFTEGEMNHLCSVKKTLCSPDGHSVHNGNRSL
jgi:hypothetical protein